MNFDFESAIDSDAIDTVNHSDRLRLPYIADEPEAVPRIINAFILEQIAAGLFDR